MNLFLNGHELSLEEVQFVSDLPIKLGLEPKMVLIEHNGTALHRSEWATCNLTQGDRIEILQVAAGG